MAGVHIVLGIVWLSAYAWLSTARWRPSAAPESAARWTR
jgi:hypothetical protein